MGTITSFYAGLLALLFLALSLNVVRGRFLHRVSVGDGGDRDLRKRMRVHANWAEYAPITLVLLLLAELQGYPPFVLHLGGATLLAGRVLHAYGFGRTPQSVPLRRVGMILTAAALVGLALLNIWRAVTGT